MQGRAIFGASVCAVASAAVIAGALARGGEQAQPQLAAASKPQLTPADLAIPLPASAEVYGSIRGEVLHSHVKSQIDISRHIRDKGHQYWGRIIGSEGDQMSQQWLSDEFKRIGLDEVWMQEDQLPPQWMPKSWEMRVRGDGKQLTIKTAHPALRSMPTPSQGLEIEAVYVGMGTPAEFVGRDVRGKAVFIYHLPYPIRSAYRDGVFSSSRESPSYPAPMKRAVDRGAAAVVAIVAVPGTNMTQQMGVVDGIPVPVFTIGLEDGTRVRELIEEARDDRKPRVHLRLDSSYVPDLKTANVWGVLHGRYYGTPQDENILITAARDGFFDAASDNASGVATMLGLAEYFARQSKESRRRTISFVGVPGHHNYMRPSVTVGSRRILADKPDFIEKTAIAIDSNLTAGLQLVSYGTGLKRATPPGSQYWYVSGSNRLREIVVSRYDLFGVPVFKEMNPTGQSVGGELGDMHGYAPTLSMTHKTGYYHSDHDTVDYVSKQALETITRAFASIIDEVNGLSMRDLRDGLEAPATTSTVSRD